LHRYDKRCAEKKIVKADHKITVNLYISNVCTNINKTINQQNIMIQDTNSLNQVAEFHTTFKHPIVKKPAIPSKERSALRISLLAEELKELQQAIEDDNLVEAADALCDLQYVLAGAVLEFGLGEKFKELFDEVHRSNMSKACKSVEEADQTVKYYMDTDGTESYHKEIEGLFLVYRTADNKTLKSVNYSPADLGGILSEG
jgi:predicted HAD superfamily Cof-like phosphohydrolase